MLRITTQTSLGSIEIAGNTPHEVNQQLELLLGESSLAARWGQLHAMLENGKGEMEAVGAVGKVLGGEVIGDPGAITFEGGVQVLTSQGLQDAQRYTGNGPNGPQTNALWWGTDSNLPITNDPRDPAIAAGTARFWLWL